MQECTGTRIPEPKTKISILVLYLGLKLILLQNALINLKKLFDHFDFMYVIEK